MMKENHRLRVTSYFKIPCSLFAITTNPSLRPRLPFPFYLPYRKLRHQSRIKKRRGHPFATRRMKQTDVDPVRPGVGCGSELKWKNWENRTSLESFLDAGPPVAFDTSGSE